MAGEDPRRHRGSLEDQLWPPDYAPVPEPPYIGLVEGLIVICFTYDRARVLPHLPASLTAAQTDTALFYVAPSPPVGLGIRDTVNIFPAILVDEMPSPDTTEAGYIPLGLMRGPARELIDRHINRCRPGDARVWTDGDLIRAEVLQEGVPVLTCAIRPGGALHDPSSAAERFFGFNARDELVTFVISSISSTQAADLVEMTITEAAPSVWQALRPVQTTYALWIPWMVFNTSAPEPWLPQPGPADAAGLARQLMRLLDRQDRAAAILDGEARVVFANAALTRLLPGPALRRLEAATPAEQARLRATLRAAGGGGLAAPFVLTAPDGGRVILQIAPLDPALSGTGAALALFDAPAQSRAPPRAEVLRALGLTPAEARIAAAVGAGLPPREAALRLGLKESTVRSSLKVVFDKLGVKRQAELVQIVARLEAR